MTLPSQIILGDSFDVLNTLAPESFDASVTDPPYGIRFMGKAWDGADIRTRTAARHTQGQNPSGRAGPNGEHNSLAAEAGKYDRSRAANKAFEEWTYEWATRMFRLLKPGAYLVSFASTRTYHRMVCGIEDAGFEIRDQLAWVFGSGFPKSSNQTGEWAGWGTALKPGWEPIVLARKPLIGSVPVNLAAHRTGALNIAASRLPFASEADEREAKEKNQHAQPESGIRTNQIYGKDSRPRDDYDADGRWPANIIHDGSPEVLEYFAQFGNKGGGHYPAARGPGGVSTSGHVGQGDLPERLMGDGTAARFYYCAKASAEDRDAGLAIAGIQPTRLARSNGAQSALSDDEAYTGGSATIGFNKVQVRHNPHPTVKPTALMRWLCRLVTPPGGRLIDPFIGSGSTGRGAVLEGFSFVGIEREAEYAPIARARVIEAAGEMFANVEMIDAQTKGAA